MFRGEPDAIQHLLNSGYGAVHIRKPYSSEKELRNLLSTLPIGCLNKIVLHDHFELTQSFPVGGVHLNSRHPQPPSGFKGTISRSCHTIDEIERYKNQCEYLFLSPIYDSISKPDYRSPFSKKQLEQARNAGIIDNKVYALGGVTHARLGEIDDLGFGGAAFMGAAGWDKLTTPPVVLSIAGSDSSGGAGIQADIKTISALSAFATSAITALTAQNTQCVEDIMPVDSGMVYSQMEAVVKDLHVDAVKIGMVYDAPTASAIARMLRCHRIDAVVYDPVMISTSGSKLMTDDTIRKIETDIFSLSTLITPNLYEAGMLAHCEIATVDDMRHVARHLCQQYGCSVLLKGGHLNSDTICDILYHDGRFHQFGFKRVESRNLHGTGCTLSSAIATMLAFKYDLLNAVSHAEQYIHQAISSSANMKLGHGQGPLWHFFKWNSDNVSITEAGPMN